MPCARTVAARLDELRLVALERAIEADLACGRDAELAAELEALVAEHPLHERFRAQQMVALYRCGRQAEALEAFRAARRTLVDELGIEPGAALRDLQRAILEQDPGARAARALVGGEPRRSPTIPVASCRGVRRRSAARARRARRAPRRGRPDASSCWPRRSPSAAELGDAVQRLGDVS